MKRFIAVVFFLGMWLPAALAQDQKGITLDQAIEIAKKEFPGTIVETEMEDGLYEVKIRTSNGEKVKLKVDPRDGTIMRKGKIIRSAGETRNMNYTGGGER